jgi:hypothetical protein
MIFWRRCPNISGTRGYTPGIPIFEKMSTKAILLICFHLAVAWGLIKWLLGSMRNFIKAIGYLIIPNWAWLTKKDYERDFTYSHKLLFILVILFVLGIMEVGLFYENK